MASKRKNFGFVVLFVIPALSFGVTGEFHPLDAHYSTDTTINENYTFENSDADPAKFTGILFQGFNTMQIDPNATLTINMRTKGHYLGYSGTIFRGQNGDTYTINGGNLVFNIQEAQKAPRTNGIEGMIMTQAKNYFKNANFDFNTNFYLYASPDVYIQRGVFTSNGNNGGYFKFTKNVFIDVSQMQPSQGWGAGKNGKGYRMIFSLEGSGAVYLNYNEATKTTLNPNNIIQLKGDLSAESTSRGNININLDNPQSFFQGRISIARGSRSVIELYLNHGGKWILNASSQITTLDANNEAYVVDNQYAHIDKLAVIDFTQVADDGISHRLTSTTFAPRTLKVDTINGANGVFRLMADMQNGQTDKIEAG
ncbi:hypothetical protein, partial [Helicobacter sp. 12S02634-8]|uniref:hypothetical protein n=1 Tax=Helicobacter sp. 12S02634-8 TaxID=1476199 RepID=UPI00117AF873